MTVDQLITSLLTRIRRDHYPGRIREYKRDERHLMQSIARYGHECHTRGWEFDEAAVYCDLAKLLDTMRPKRELITYLPLYLEGAVDRHIRTRADELHDAALRLDSRLGAARARALAKRGEPLPRTCEILSKLYTDLARRRRQARRQRTRATRATRAQPNLL